MAELLAPVGSQEALVAAVESGADAVYLAGKSFGARAYAANFADEELADAVRYAHLRDVKVYVTVNTIVYDSEFPLLIPYLCYLYTLGVDAIIVQDFGVALAAKQCIPAMKLHASTQMTIHNVAGTEFLAQQGFSRAVLARELSLEDVTVICQQSGVDIETFIHGALCISYSGQCLMSSMIGGRSGNRGRCAQPCRLPYTLVDSDGEDRLREVDAGEFLLSPKDLKTIDLLPALMQAGVDSFKVEGRMKRPEYVAVVIHTYRQAIDEYVRTGERVAASEQAQKELAQIFNRDFTTAYLQGRPGRAMMSDRRPNNRGVKIGRVIDYMAQNKMARIKLEEPLASGDIIEFWVKIGGRVNTTVSSLLLAGEAVAAAPAGVEVAVAIPAPVRVNDRVFKVFDAALMTKARSFFGRAAAVRRVPITVAVEVSEGQPLQIRMSDQQGCQGQAATVFRAEKALKRPLSETSVCQQINRLGSTAFAVQEFQCRIHGEVMVPVSEINEARRRAVENLEQARLSRYARPALPQPIPNLLPEPITRRSQAATPCLTVNLDSLAKLQTALRQQADVIMFGGECFGHRAIGRDEYQRALAMVREAGKRIIFNTPRIVKQAEIPALIADLALFQRLRPDAVSIANPGVLQLARQHMDLPFHGDYPLNIYNSLAIRFYADLGVSSLTLSPELNMNQVEELAVRNDLELECLAHGYLTLMVSEYCVLGSYLGQLPSGGACPSPCTKRDYWLRDRKGEKFPVQTDQYCRMHILNAMELSMLPHVNRFKQMGIRRIRIEGKQSSLTELSALTALYRQILDLEDGQPPLRVQESIARLEHDHITRGHYFRGVV